MIALFSRLPVLFLVAALLSVGGLLWLAVHRGNNRPENDGGNSSGGAGSAGEVVTTYRDIPVYSNGDDFTVSHGKHYSGSGYYYGQKWQCVEFVKRFYFDAFNHRMPSVWGHAKDFYHPASPHGEINPERAMLQFKNGGPVAPQPDDLLVFDFAPFGHVAVVSEVRSDTIEVVQQNVAGRPRQVHPLRKRQDRYFVGSERKPAGWLRLPSRNKARAPSPKSPTSENPAPSVVHAADCALCGVAFFKVQGARKERIGIRD